MANTILQHLVERRLKFPTETALQFKENGRWVKYHWQEYFQLCESVGAALCQLEVTKGDRIAIISDTRPEWVLIDMAIMGVGGITVPIYPNNSDDDVEYILNNAQIKVLFVEDFEQLEKWQRLASRCPSVKEVVVIEPPKGKVINATTWAEILRRGRDLLAQNPHLFIDLCRKTEAADVATVLYTSGTTGRPKGVVLSHKQILSELNDVFTTINITSADSSLTFLPFSHIFGRVESWGSIYAGYVLAFAESIEKIRQNLAEVKPTFLIAVPRIFEKIYAGILAQVASHRIKREIFDRAVAVGRQVSARTQENQPLGVLLAAQYALAYQLVFKKIIDGLGGQLRLAVSGGAPLNAEITRFFYGMGLSICEGYGLTETTAGVTFNTPYDFRIGSVGKPLGDVKVKIADDGEVLVKSDKVMVEYYQDEKATREAFTDGYFKTGDIGHIDDDGFLFITDRKKDLIKTAGGKYVAPQKLEGLLKINPYVSNVLIHGDLKKYIVALITLNHAVVLNYAKLKGLPELSFQDLVKTPEIYALVRDIVADANSHLASFESIKKFAILPNDFTIETGELTPSLKVKRRFCDTKFKQDIDELYT